MKRGRKRLKVIVDKGLSGTNLALSMMRATVIQVNLYVADALLSKLAQKIFLTYHTSERARTTLFKLTVRMETPDPVTLGYFKKFAYLEIL